MVDSILVADDDLDFRLIIRLALEASGYKGRLYFVNDGLELMDFLRHRGAYPGWELPGLIILDLNMPKKSGREALSEIKADPGLGTVPVVVMSASDLKEDQQLSRDFNCAFIRKPDSYSQWVNAMEALLKFYE